MIEKNKIIQLSIFHDHDISLAEWEEKEKKKNTQKRVKTLKTSLKEKYDLNNYSIEDYINCSIGEGHDS